jgi:hypothetical protein
MELSSENYKANMPDTWTKVESRKSTRKKSLSIQDQTVFPIKRYWNGFNKNGCKMWYIELNNGIILPDYTKEYEIWFKKYYSQCI